MKYYDGKVPACGVFCGGCPVYIRDKKPCPGASANCERCGRCKSFFLCCETKGIKHCFECEKFPCSRFRQFRKSWLKYGQDLIENQKILGSIGESEFIRNFNKKISE